MDGRNPLSAVQLSAFERDGSVTVETGLTTSQLDAAERAFEQGELAPPHQPFLDFISHPQLEAIAKQVLRADRAFILESGPMERPPADPRDPPPPSFGAKHGLTTEWANGMHSDVQVTSSDFAATPRREHLAIWVWLKDVPAERAALRVLAGSHRALGDHWEKMIALSAAGQELPLTHGPRWEDPGEPDARHFAAQEPTPQVARRGQATVWTQAALHSSWHNSDVLPRVGFAISWVAWGVVSAASTIASDIIASDDPLLKLCAVAPS